MARAHLTPETLDSLAKEIRDIADNLIVAAEVMRDAKLPSVLTHSGSAENTYIPELDEWSRKLRTDAETQSRTHAKHRPIRAQIDKDRYRKYGKKK